MAANASSSSTGPARGVTAGPEVITDLSYAPVSARQKLDLYLPERTGIAVPLVVVIHGGAWLVGDKADEAARAKDLARRGYAVASLNYRLSGEARFPAAVQDVKAAVRFLRVRAPDHGIDPSRFAVWGSSAGGYLAAMLGVTGGGPSPFDAPELGNPGVPSAVQAVVDWFGPANFLSMDAQALDPGGCPADPEQHDRAASPESRFLGAPIRTVPDLAHQADPARHLRSGIPMPPFRIVHGRLDCLVPHGQSVELAAAVRAAGGQVTLRILDDQGHGGAGFEAAEWAPTVQFLDEVLRG